MALPKNLEDLLKAMDPAVAKAQREFWEGNPAIAAAVDSGTVPKAVFSRELNAKDDEVKKANELSGKWKSWADENVPKHKQAIDDNAKLEQEKKDLEAKVAEAAEKISKAGGGEVDVNEELLAKVETRMAGRTMSKDAVAAVIKEESEKLTKTMTEAFANERKNFFEKTLPESLAWQSGMLEAQFRYEKEFGKPLPKADFGKFMTDNKITDPEQAYKMFTEPDVRKREIEAEVEKRLKEERGKATFPGVSSGDSFGGDKGYLQLRIEGGESAVKFPENSNLGDRTAAVMAAKELREAGTF